MMMDEETHKRAFDLWYPYYGKQLGFHTLDEKVSPFLSEKIKPKRTGWLRQARQALFISTGEAARRAGIAKATYIKIEKCEALGTAKINTLARIAETLDCKLVYALRPKNRKHFSEMIWEPLMQESIEHPWVKTRPKHLKAQALAAIAKRKINEPEFRQSQNWSER